MNEAALTALEESVAYWERIRDGKAVRFSGAWVTTKKAHNHAQAMVNLLRSLLPIMVQPDFDW